MKTNIIIAGLFVILISGCTFTKYLPSSDKIDVNEYGSYIRIVLMSASTIDGELIAIDSNKIVVLSETKMCRIVAVDEVQKFSIFYAQPKNYGWTIPTGLALPLIPFPDPAGGGLMPFHGYISSISIPINLIVTISVTAAGRHAFKYSDKNMTYDNLRMFARFPQGIPLNIDIASLK